MISRHVAEMIPKFAEARYLCRTFSTHPRLQAEAPPYSPPSTTRPPHRSPQSPSAPSTPTRNPSRAYELADNLKRDTFGGKPPNKATQYEAKKRAMEDYEKMGRADALEKQVLRKWKLGDVYAPHDLSGDEMKKWGMNRPGQRDAFDVLGINPLHEYKNPTIMSEYSSSMGRIKPREATGLRRVNQRKVAKAIRRAVGMGLIPSVHRHPEILEYEARERAEKKFKLELHTGGKARTYE